MSDQKKVLLTSVFKPFAVDDAYGRKENIPDTMHNQLTHYQGVFSLRERQYSHQLHLLANNLEHPVTVLDYPTLRRFQEEIRKEYDYVGISFIQPNFLKAKKMAELTRQLAPRSEIIIGGFGTMIDNIANIIEHDHICRGEGISFLRKLLGEPEKFEFRHPLIPTYEFLGTLGISVRALAVLFRLLGIHKHVNADGVIITGVGCAGGCDFCSSGQFFEPRRITFLKSGREIFELMLRYEELLGIKSFMLIGDENVFSDQGRMEELHGCLRENGKDFNIYLSFSSTNHLSRYDPRFLAELGVEVIWIGVESRSNEFSKNAGVDIPNLLEGLRRYGIKTVLSSILCLEGHTRENIREDINWHISLNPTLSQFAQISPSQGTVLWRRLMEQEKILHSIPLEERHGFKQIWFKHPHFTLQESERIQREAYQKDFSELGPSLVRWIRTNYEAYPWLLNSGSEILKRRAEAISSRMGHYRILLRAAELLAPEEKMAQNIQDLRSSIEKDFGKLKISENLLAGAVFLLGKSQELRQEHFGDVIQPRTMVTEYNK